MTMINSSKNKNSLQENNIYYVINVGNDKSKWGLLTIYYSMIPYISYAKKQGYIPIIDWQHCSSKLFKDGREYKDNIWEYFFKQPAGVSLNDLNDKSQIIVADAEDIKDLVIEEPHISANIKKYKEIFIERFKSFDLIDLNDEIKNYLDEMLHKSFNGETEVLEIIARGTDYTTLRPHLHKVQPDIQTVIKEAKELYKKYSYKKIWISTEDEDIYKIFQKEFGDKLIKNFQYKYHSQKNLPIADYSHINRENHFYNLSKEYLASIYILSKCKYIIGGFCGGIFGAFYLSKGFENQKYVQLWNIGTYGVWSQLKYKNKIEKIFSVKNRYYEDNKFKVLTLLGYKLKFKNGKIKNISKPYVNNQIN